jgi:hypothetical protein
MTDRFRTITVLLEHDTREDDVERVLTCIRSIHGVDDVKLGEPVSSSDWIARQSAKRKLGEAVWELIAGKDDS